MRRLSAKYERVLDDIRSDLEDSDGQDWDETVEGAMSRAWDEFSHLGDTNRTE